MRLRIEVNTHISGSEEAAVTWETLGLFCVVTDFSIIIQRCLDQSLCFFLLFLLLLRKA